MLVIFGLNEGVGETEPALLISLVSLEVELLGFFDVLSLSCCLFFCRCFARRFLNQT